MTKREEIMGGIEVILRRSVIESFQNGLASKQILDYLHSQGVVIKGETLGGSHPHLANYFTVEPLVKE